jgi:hypothetical protein
MMRHTTQTPFCGKQKQKKLEFEIKRLLLTLLNNDTVEAT